MYVQFWFKTLLVERHTVSSSSPYLEYRVFILYPYYVGRDTSFGLLLCHCRFFIIYIQRDTVLCIMALMKLESHFPIYLITVLTGFAQEKRKVCLLLQMI